MDISHLNLSLAGSPGDEDRDGELLAGGSLGKLPAAYKPLENRDCPDVWQREIQTRILSARCWFFCWWGWHVARLPVDFFWSLLWIDRLNVGLSFFTVFSICHGTQFPQEPSRPFWNGGVKTRERSPPPGERRDLQLPKDRSPAGQQKEPGSLSPIFSILVNTWDDAKRNRLTRF